MTELQHQIAVIKWTQQPIIRAKFPILKLLYHIPNERKCTPAQGKILKDAGVKSGVPDLHLPVARGKYHGLYIEMKTPTGKTSDSQAWWIEELRNQGNFAVVCRGWEEAIKCLTLYLNLK